MMLSTMKQPTAPTTSNLSPHPPPSFVAQSVAPIRHPRPVALIRRPPATPTCHPRLPPSTKNTPSTQKNPPNPCPFPHFFVYLYSHTQRRAPDRPRPCEAPRTYVRLTPPLLLCPLPSYKPDNISLQCQLPTRKPTTVA